MRGGERVFKTEEEAKVRLGFSMRKHPTIYQCPSGYGWHIDFPFTKSEKMWEKIYGWQDDATQDKRPQSKSKRNKTEPLPEKCPTCKDIKWLQAGRRRDGVVTFGAMTFQDEKEAKEWVSAEYSGNEKFFLPKPCLHGYGWHIERLP